MDTLSLWNPTPERVEEVSRCLLGSEFLKSRNVPRLTASPDPMTQNALFSASTTVRAAPCRPITRSTQGLDFLHHHPPSSAPGRISRELLKAQRNDLLHFVLCLLFCLF